MSLTTSDKKKFSISKRLERFLVACKNKIENKDRMVIILLWGDPGSGKSVVAQKFAHIVSPNLISIDKIAFDKDELIRAVLACQKETVIGDEGIALFFSRGAMSKEGRLMAELMGQCRQKNLFLPICMIDILNTDSMILKLSSAICYVWESEKLINGRMVTIKGNLALYPKFRHVNYKDRMIQYLKRKKANPFVREKRPVPYLTMPGDPFGPEFRPAFYAVDEILYRAKKDAILNKYRKTIINRKPQNKLIDYKTMDALLKAHIPQKRIALMLNVHLKTVQNRKSKKNLKRILKPTK